jgi:hypothetical protein
MARDPDELRIDLERAAQRAADPEFLETIITAMLVAGVHEVEHRGRRVFARRGEFVGEVTHQRMAKGLAAIVETKFRRARAAREHVLWSDPDRITSEEAAMVWLLAFPRTPTALTEVR